MRRGLLLGVTLFALTIPGILAQASSSGSCGRERWAVKTGTDYDAGRVKLTDTNATTISYLTSRPYPGSLPSDGRVAPVETTVWQVDATLVEYKLEHDSDYHVVISNNSGLTMITEIPDPGCVGSSSPFRAAIAHARAQFDARYNPTDSFQRAGIPMRITGVGFFDFAHFQTGAAPNQVELHPVLDIVFNPSPPETTPGGTEAPGPTPSAVPGGPPSGRTSLAGGVAVRAVLLVLALAAAGWFFLRRR
jgi:hypothetical protein